MVYSGPLLGIDFLEGEIGEEVDGVGMGWLVGRRWRGEVVFCGGLDGLVGACAVVRLIRRAGGIWEKLGREMGEGESDLLRSKQIYVLQSHCLANVRSIMSRKVRFTHRPIVQRWERPSRSVTWERMLDQISGGRHGGLEVFITRETEMLEYSYIG